jgi:hypothetical protein
VESGLIADTLLYVFKPALTGPDRAATQPATAPSRSAPGASRRQARQQLRHTSYSTSGPAP